MAGEEASPTAHDSAVLVLSYHGLKIMGAEPLDQGLKISLILKITALQVYILSPQ